MKNTATVEALELCIVGFFSPKMIIIMIFQVLNNIAAHCMLFKG